MRRTDSLKLATACGVACAYGLLLVLWLTRGQWILDPHGTPIVTDFLPVYVAGQLALSGHAAIAYDWRHFHDVQASFIGHAFPGFLGWHYPPLYFVVAAALACFPYFYAFLGWAVTTVAAYAATASMIVRRGAFFALALPPVLACAMVGQNGLFSTALLGWMLLWLPERPYLAGSVLAALTFKPQFGILLPFVLLGAGHWKSVGVAALLTLGWIATGYLISPSSFVGFLHYLPETGHAILEEGSSGWNKLQSVYALARLLGATNQTAWFAQIGLALAAGSFCIWLWRGDRSYWLKAAALSTSVLLATPYVYFYDLPLLSLPLLFLARDRDFDWVERLVLGALVGSLMAFAFLPGPFGLLATVLTATIVIRRLG